MKKTSPYTFALSPSDPQWPTTVQATDIPHLLVYERETFSDERGFFREVVELRDIEKVLGKSLTIKQWNHSSSKPGVLRGFHAEPWEKLIYVAKGTVLAVLVDLRIDSPAFGKALKLLLGETSRKTLYLPLGIGNSFCTIGDGDAEYMYLVTDYYQGKPTPAISLLDPLITKQIGGWPIKNPIMSDKDKNYPTLKETFADKVDFALFPWLKDA